MTVTRPQPAARPPVLTIAYLIALPLLLIAAVAGAVLIIQLSPATPRTIELAGLLVLGMLALVCLLNSAFLIVGYIRSQPPHDRIALVIIGALLTLLFGAVITVIAYPLTLYSTLRTPERSVRDTLIRMIAPTLIVLLIFAAFFGCLGHLMFGEHYFDTPAISSWGYHRLQDSDLVYLAEVESDHAVGVYLYPRTPSEAADPAEWGVVGFALYSTKSVNGKTGYRMETDTDLCHPATIFEASQEGYTVRESHDGGFKRYTTEPWGEWISVGDVYSVCLIPESVDLAPDDSTEVVHTAKITLDGTDFRLYVGMSE